MAIPTTDELCERIARQGGLTIDLRSGREPVRGFAVASAADCEVSIPLDDFSPERLQRFIAMNDALLQRPEQFLGAWVERGLVYLDVSTVLDDREAAWRLGQRHKQLAIFDLARGESIALTPDASASSSAALVLERVG
ncbi:MAG: hypothetical protein DCC58_16935 [Chloroflexi bacterium]|nr:MAG: hypothetical protein DCC58_16935 [Chloroflexota bacterium]